MKSSILGNVYDKPIYIGSDKLQDKLLTKKEIEDLIIQKISSSSAGLDFLLQHVADIKKILELNTYFDNLVWLGQNRAEIQSIVDKYQAGTFMPVYDLIGW